MNDDAIKQALEIVKAQAGVRSMTEEEIIQMVERITNSITTLQSASASSSEGTEPYISHYSSSASSAVKENAIVCLECGKSFRILTKRHLALHNVTVDGYKEKYGYHRNIPLVCRSLQRERKEIMSSMKLWERRKCSSSEADTREVREQK